MADHIRSQIYSCDLMSQFSQKNGKKSGTASHIQDSEFPFRQILKDLSHPFICHIAVKLSPSLFLKAVTAFGPVGRNFLLAAVLFSAKGSISDHRAILDHLKASNLIKDHAVQIGIAFLQDLSFIIFGTAQIFPGFHQISRLFGRIPQTGHSCRLIPYIFNFHRIIGTVASQSLIDSQETKNIPHILSCRFHFLCSPAAHLSPFDQYTGDSTGGCIIISSS